MKSQGQDIYIKMLEEMGVYSANISSFRSWIENCFNAAFVACSSLQDVIDRGWLAAGEEEIWFSQTLKLKLDAAMEYFVLLYSAELFGPEGEEEKMNYWYKELRRHKDYLIEHEEDSSLAAKRMAREKYLEYVQREIVRLVALRP